MKNILDWQSFNEGYNKPRAGGKRRWSVKYKKKINCSNPKGFSQKQYCKRKRRGGHYKTESVQSNSMKVQIEQMFFDVSDVSNWYVHVDEYHTSKDGFIEPCAYEVYISFGDTEAYRLRDEDYDGELECEQRKIDQSLIDCITRSIEVMDGEGFSYQLLYCTEFSSDPGEDYIEKLEIDDLEPGQWISENDSIRIKFSK